MLAIRPGDIMILLPRREPFGGEVIRQLKLRGIPVAGADRIVLTEQIAVMDLMALGRFVLQREDDLNLAALLRSPLCGARARTICFDLCHGRKPWNRLAIAARKTNESRPPGFRGRRTISWPRCWSAPITHRRSNSTPMP